MRGYHTGGQLGMLLLLFSSSSHVVVNSSDIAPDPPENLQYAWLSPTSVMLSWDPVKTPPEQPVKAYSVKYNEIDSGAMDQHAVTQNASYLLERLKPDTNYTVQVRTYTNYASKPSKPLYIRTREEGNPLAVSIGTRYEANWTSLDTRPIPEWYDKAKIGIFMHWGVFSVPSFGSEWFWAYWKGGNPSIVEFMKKNYPPGFTYQDFAPKFTAEFYNPEEWAKIFEAAGAKYVVLTSKHHEGYTMWPSKYSWGWNVMDVGPRRDLLGDLATAIRNVTPDIHFGLYHSLYEWYNPLYQLDKKNNFTTNKFSMGKTMPELYELVNNYQPEVIWSDGDWEVEDWYWNSTIFLAWLFNDSPVKDTVLVNDRWGKGIPCHHGSFYNCKDRYNPGVLQTHKWENAMTLDKKSWGYRRTASATDYLTIEEVLKTVAMTISCGGNILINIGPTHDGRIPAIMEERLRQMGTWLGINGDAIYESQPWTHQNDSLTEDVWYTQKGSSVYAIVLNWPDGGVLTLSSVVGTASTQISMLGFNQDSPTLQYKMMRKGLQVVFPPMSQVVSQWAWVLVMQDIMPAKTASRKRQQFVTSTQSPNHIWNYNP